MRAFCWVAVSMMSMGWATASAQTGIGGVVGSFGGSLGGAPKQPYTATRKTTSVQKLFDGTTITRITIEKEARDSQGRTFRQTQMGMPMGMAQQSPVFFYNVMDPLDRVTLSWSTQGKVVTRFHTPEPPTLAEIHARVQARTQATPAAGQGAGVAGVGVAAVSSGIATGTGPTGAAQIDGLRTLPDTTKVPKTHLEQLDGKTIAGVYAKGTRLTTTYPVGYMGNDRPIAVVVETWNSPDLGIGMLIINDDPRTGVQTTELTDIDRNEPDPALFKVPEGYTVKEQSQDPR